MLHILPGLPIGLKSFGHLSKSRQKLDIILENKVGQKVKFSENVNTKSVLLKSYSSMEIIFSKIQIILDIEN